MDCKSIFIVDKVSGLRKETFNSPVIKVPIHKMRFPRICPVCGLEANETTRLTLYKNAVPSMGARWGQDLKKKLSGKRALLVHVCEDHKFTDDEEMNYKTLCACSNGLLFSLFLFSFFWIGSDFWLGRPLNVVNLSIGVAFFFSVIASVYAFRTNPLKEYLRVIGSDRDQRFLWLELRNEAYREEFMKENAVQAELVSWVVWS